VNSMGASGSIEQEQPVRAGPKHEPTPPDAAELRKLKGALKNANLKQGDSRKLKAAALGNNCVTAAVKSLSYNKVGSVYPRHSCKIALPGRQKRCHSAH